MPGQATHETGGRLARKLLRSHLTVAAVGLATLGVALISTFWLRSQTVRLATVRGPLAQAAITAQSGIQRSLAALRGWVALGAEEFESERKSAWREEIEPNVETLSNLGREHPDVLDNASLAEITRLLDGFHDSQWWVADVGQTSGNHPGQVLFDREIAPVSRSMLAATTAMIREGRLQQSRPEGRELLADLVDFRESTWLCLATLRDFMTSGSASDERRLQGQLAIARGLLADIVRRGSQIVGDQQDQLTRIREEFPAFERHQAEVVSLRRSDAWNVARHLMRTETAAIGRQLTGMLDTLAASQTELLRRDTSRVVLLSNVAILVLLGLIGVMGVAAWLVSTRSAKQISEPVLSLAQATHKLAEGTLREDIPVTSDDELGQLTRSFNSMRASLESQAMSIMEMSTPVMQVWPGILLLPVVGIVDSKRAQDIADAALTKISEMQAKVFILDISGVAVVDTAVANHLLKIARMSRLLGCECMISGVSKVVALTMIELGVELNEMRTQGTLEASLVEGLKSLKLQIATISTSSR